MFEIKIFGDETCSAILKTLGDIFNTTDFITIEELLRSLNNTLNNNQMMVDASYSSFDGGYDENGWVCKGLKPVIRRERLDQVNLTFPDPVSRLKYAQKGETKMDMPISFDPVANPSHYCKGVKYEPRKVIHDWGLNFNLGNAVKYIARAGKKGNKVEDLRKAIQYIKFELEEMGYKDE